MSNNDYFQVLGLSQGASDDEIKKAYRKLALECHPDHHPADPVLEERFKRATEAYSILGDAEKRREYDLLSRRGEGLDDPYGQSPEDMFLQFVQSEGFDFRKASCIGGVRGCRRGTATYGNGRIYNVSITPVEAALGTQKEIFVPTQWNQKKFAFKIPPGVDSGSQFRLVLSRAKGISILVRIQVVDQDRELTSEAAVNYMPEA